MALLGVSHLLRGDGRLDEAIEARTREGYQLVFRERQPMPSSKLRFLRGRPTDHELAYLRSPRGVSIELLCHHPFVPTGVTGRYRVYPAMPGEVEDAGLPAVVAELSRERTLAVLPCASLAATTDFWTAGLGFTRVTDATVPPSTALLEFRSRVPSWNLRLLLVERAGAPDAEGFLDDAGWVCVSILVTRLDDTLAALAKQGARDVGEPAALVMGGRKIRICFLRGPSLELIELMEVS